jgi:hypothetical protein
MSIETLARRLALMEWVRWEDTTTGARADYRHRARLLIGG